MRRSTRALAATIAVVASALLLTGSASHDTGTSNVPISSPPTVSSPPTDQPSDPSSESALAFTASSEIVSAFADSGLAITNISDLSHVCGDGEGQVDCRSAELTAEVMVVEWNDLEERDAYIDPSTGFFAGDFSLSLNPEVVDPSMFQVYADIFEQAVAGS
jgi:hypothetical protein